MPGGGSLQSSSQPIQKGPRSQDFNSKWLSKDQQVLIATDNELSARSQRACDVRIVRCVAAPLFSQGRRADDERHPNKPFERWSWRTSELRAPGLEFRDSLPPFGDDCFSHEGSHPPTSYQKQALVGFSAPTAARKYRAGVKNGPNHVRRWRRCLPFASAARARRLAEMMARSSSGDVSRSHAPACAFSRAAMSASIRRFSQSRSASRTTSLAETYCPERTSRLTWASCSLLRLTFSVAFGICPHTTTPAKIWQEAAVRTRDHIGARG